MILQIIGLVFALVAIVLALVSRRYANIAMFHANEAGRWCDVWDYRRGAKPFEEWMTPYLENLYRRVQENRDAGRA